jgi:hypothetical protein
VDKARCWGLAKVSSQSFMTAIVLNLGTRLSWPNKGEREEERGDITPWGVVSSSVSPEIKALCLGNSRKKSCNSAMEETQKDFVPT